MLAKIFNTPLSNWFKNLFVCRILQDGCWTMVLLCNCFGWHLKTRPHSNWLCLWLQQWHHWFQGFFILKVLKYILLLKYVLLWAWQMLKQPSLISLVLHKSFFFSLSPTLGDWVPCGRTCSFTGYRYRRSNTWHDALLCSSRASSDQEPVVRGVKMMSEWEVESQCNLKFKKAKFCYLCGVKYVQKLILPV